MHRYLYGAAVAAVLSMAASGAAMAQAGLLTGGATELEPPLKLSAGQPLAEAPYELEAGKYYELEIEADGSQELAISGPSFFRNVWIDEIVINEIEIRPLGVDSLEFDDEGTASISFVTIKPGTLELRIAGTTSDRQRAVFNVK